MNLLLISIFIPFSANATIYGHNSFEILDPKSQPSIGIQTLYFPDQEVMEQITKVSSKTLEQKGVCKSESWSTNKTMGHCTGFMMSSDWLLTGGHCVPTKEACKMAKWVFPDRTFEEYKEGPNGFTQVPTSQTVTCMEILASSHTDELDYALIRVSHPQRNFQDVWDQALAAPLREGEEISTISFPLGTSMKKSTGRVRRVDQKSGLIVSNIDAMRGSSGAPIYLANTNKLVGILARGERDYSPGDDICHNLKKCEDHDCRGEEIIPIQAILADIEKKILSF